MASDKKKRKARGKGGKLTKPTVAVVVIGIVGLVGMYYLRTGAFPLEGGNLAEFLTFQWLW